MLRARRKLLVVLAAVPLFFTSISFVVAADSPAVAAKPKTLWVYFGAYARGEGKGIYVSRMDVASGKLQSPEVAIELTNPSFLALHPSRPLMYAIGEMGSFGGKKTGAVSALAMNTKTGKLALLNQQSSGGPGPCHVAVDREGRNVLVANYSGGSAACLPIGADGRLGEATSVVQHQGSGPDPKRQNGPHAHSINLDPAGRFAFVADLGLDKIFIYKLDAAAGKLIANEPAFAQVAPGSGPRHFAFHPTGRFAYVINEMLSTVTAFRYDADRGALAELQTVSTLPADFTGSNTTAEVQVHPSGKFVYGSNRGHDSIAIFAVDPESGKLRAAGHQSTQGKNPRNFGIDPTGAYLLAANQDGDNVVAFRIDAATGALQPTGQSLTISKPVCVKFVRAE